jgi:hypothetical protein
MHGRGPAAAVEKDKSVTPWVCRYLKGFHRGLIDTDDKYRKGYN